jgi:hypothetical protein
MPSNGSEVGRIAGGSGMLRTTGAGEEEALISNDTLDRFVRLFAYRLL